MSCAVLAQLVYRRPLVLKLRFKLCQLQAQGLCLFCNLLRRSQRFHPRRGQLRLALHQLDILVYSLLALRRRRGSLLIDRLHAPVQIAKQSVDALKRRLRSAPALFQAR